MRLLLAISSQSPKFLTTLRAIRVLEASYGDAGPHLISILGPGQWIAAKSNSCWTFQHEIGRRTGVEILARANCLVREQITLTCMFTFTECATVSLVFTGGTLTSANWTSFIKAMWSASRR